MAKVTAVLVDSIMNESNPPGAFKYYAHGDPAVDGSKIIGLNFVCPCGCGLVGSISFGCAASGHPRWTWDGNYEAPTCTPSIGFYGMNDPSQGHHWHGFLTAGEFVPC